VREENGAHKNDQWTILIRGKIPRRVRGNRIKRRIISERGGYKTAGERGQRRILSRGQVYWVEMREEDKKTIGGFWVGGVKIRVGFIQRWKVRVINTDSGWRYISIKHALDLGESLATWINLWDVITSAGPSEVGKVLVRRTLR